MESVNNDPLIRIRARRHSAERALAVLETRLLDLRNEVQRLKIAEEVLASLADNEGDEISRPDAQTVGAKPDGTPTVPEMVQMILRDPTAHDGSGMEPKEIVAIISKRWWPGVTSEAVAPTVWRMAKDGRLEKDGSRYRLPHKNEAAEGGSDQESSTASDSPAEGREAGPGGGP